MEADPAAKAEVKLAYGKNNNNNNNNREMRNTNDQDQLNRLDMGK